MSLNINVDFVSAVLLPDGWHEVANHSFDIDAYEFMHDEQMIWCSDQGAHGNSGFHFRSADGHTYEGPMSSVLAVRS